MDKVKFNIRENVTHGDGVASQVPETREKVKLTSEKSPECDVTAEESKEGEIR